MLLELEETDLKGHLNSNSEIFSHKNGRCKAYRFCHHPW